MRAEQYVKPTPSPRVIVAAVIITAGRVLACERSSPPEAAGRWEFPGGKREAGESLEEAMRRELIEELSARFAVGERVETVRWDYPEQIGRAHV